MAGMLHNRTILQATLLLFPAIIWVICTECTPRHHSQCRLYFQGDHRNKTSTYPNTYRNRKRETYNSTYQVLTNLIKNLLHQSQVVKIAARMHQNWTSYIRKEQRNVIDRTSHRTLTQTNYFSVRKFYPIL